MGKILRISLNLRFALNTYCYGFMQRETWTGRRETNIMRYE